jgi:hypothetical protein
MVDQQCPDPYPYSKTDQRCGGHGTRARPDIDHRGVVLRNINHLRIRRLNYINCLARRLLHLHLLFRGAAQSARVISLISQALNRSRDCSLIRREGLTDGRIIVDILRHHVEHLRKIDERDKCRIESLLLRCIRQCCARQRRILRQPVIHIQNFLRIGRSRGDLRKQRIGIKRDRRQQLIQFLR